MELIDRFWFALRFFTRLPLGKLGSHDGRLSDAATLFPVAGAVIGLMTGLVWLVAGSFLPPLPAAGIAIAFSILLTGALHEDGLGDCADGLGPNVSREKSLDIMRDSRVGSYGAIALILTIALRWTALASLTPAIGLACLIVAHAGSRTMILLPLANLAYARKEGLGSMVEDGLPAATAWLTVLATAIAAWFLAGTAGLLAVMVATGLTWLTQAYLKKRLGGYTGDGLGAIQQIAEIAVLLTFAGYYA